MILPWPALTGDKRIYIYHKSRGLQSNSPLEQGPICQVLKQSKLTEIRGWFSLTHCFFYFDNKFTASRFSGVTLSLSANTLGKMNF